MDVEQINQFLYSITPIVENIGWYEPSRHNPAKAKLISNLILPYRQKRQLIKIYETYFTGDLFFDSVQTLAPDISYIKEEEQSLLGKTKKSHPPLKNYFITCLKATVEKYGFISPIISLIVFSSCPLEKEFSEKDIRRLLGKYSSMASKNTKIYHVFEKVEYVLLSSKLKDKKLSFGDLCKLLHLRYDLGGPFSDVCNAILDAIPKTNIDEITKGVEFDDVLFSECGDIKYKPLGSKSNSVFLKDFYNKLHENNKINNKLALQAFLFFMRDLKSCPLKYLVLASLYNMNDGDPLSAAEGFYHAGVKYYDISYYHESMDCLKNSLFNAAFIFENPLDFIDMDTFIQVANKLNSYEDSINFLSKFKLLQEHGLSIHQGFLNEIESTKTTLEYRHNALTYHKIDGFYELVAQENFPEIQSHIVKKGKGAFTLTGEQLQILLRKIQEKSDIIRGIKSISAKCDMLMYMHREIYDKQAAFFEVMKENHGSIENLISQNTEKIIESIHKKNETFISQINIKTAQDFYHDVLGVRLWKSLDEATRTFLMLARHLDTTNQFSPSDEFGFVAIEYAKAIENEFKKKIIDGCLSKEPHIKYRGPERVIIITQDTVITMGSICSLIDKTKKVKGKEDLLWQLHSFIINHTNGRQKLFDLKNALFDIKDKYRNPAAHPVNYSRERLDSFKSLLFQKAFLKDYLSCMQMEK
ncbi:MAG: hypothetical protein HY807_00470 [Nitrospirae bacterium]|nr:hypothetical protein [Nitrospirota bacterium]